MKFKVGDIVKVKFIRSTSARWLDDQIGTITDCQPADGEFGEFGSLDIEKKLENPGGVWFDELIFISHAAPKVIKRYGIADFMEKKYA